MIYTQIEDEEKMKKLKLVLKAAKDPIVFKDVQDQVQDFHNTLTPQEINLCLFHCSLGDKDLAIIDSGYNPLEFDNTIWDRKDISDFIQQIWKRIQVKVSPTEEQIKSELLEVYELHKYDPKGGSTALKALDQLTKISGFDIQKIQTEDITEDKDYNITIEMVQPVEEYNE